jgi:DNA-binding GntR family transcriptional regulator
MGAFHIMRIIEREAAESAAARRRPDDYDALDAIRSDPTIVRRVFAAMRHRADDAPGGAGRGRRRPGRAARAH